MIKRNVSVPLNFTQSWAADSQVYTEVFSPVTVSIPGNKHFTIKSIVNEGFYFRVSQAIDTPVSAMLAVISDEDFSARIRELYPSLVIKGDPGNGVPVVYDGTNPEVLRLPVTDHNAFRPFNWEIYAAPETAYDTASAYAIIKGKGITYITSLLIQGNSYAAPFEIPVSAQGQKLLIIPFVAGLKKTELACASRLSFDLEVDG